MTAKDVLASKEFLQRIGMWSPVPPNALPEVWLDNFPEQMREHAVALLEASLFLTQVQVSKMFLSAVHDISAEVTALAHTYSNRQQQWQQFLETAHVTWVSGETPSAADSGYTYARLMRDEFGIQESQIAESSAIVRALLKNDRNPVLVVDDFAGTGDQFVRTWQRQVLIATGFEASLSSEIASRDNVYFVTAVATQRAIDRISKVAPAVKVRTGNVIPNEMSANHPTSQLFPTHLRTTSSKFIIDSSIKAGVASGDEFGHGDLALSLSLGGSVPDANLPIVTAENAKWNPLMRRS